MSSWLRSCCDLYNAALLGGQPAIGDYVDAWLTSEELELPPEAFTLLKMKAEWRRARMRRHIAVGA